MGNCCNSNNYVHFYSSNNSGCSGRRDVPVVHMPVRTPSFGNGDLFKIKWDIKDHGCSQSKRYIDIYPKHNGSCGCNDDYSSFFDNYNCGYNYPVFYYGGAGTTNGNGTATAWSRKGFASSTPAGSTIINNTRDGSKNYNLGIAGSYASGGGNKAWNVLGGLLSYAKSGGNKSVDASGLVNNIISTIIGWFSGNK